MKKLVLLLSFFVSIAAFGQNVKFDKDGIPVRPNPPRLVNDLANVIPDNQERQLEQSLREFSNSTSTQIVVLTTPTLNGNEKAQFTYEVGEKWGVGNKKFDNGLVVMVKPKEIDGKGEVFIATGYGLEGVVPDAIAKRIVEVEMIPQFKQKNYTGGIFSAVQVLQELSLKEYSAKEYAEKHQKKSRRGRSIGFVVIILLVIVFSIVGRVQRARQYSMGHGTSFWTALFLASSMGRSHSGSWSDFSSGGGGFGGGGFGGFGGGSFGGGGAGGSW